MRDALFCYKDYDADVLAISVDSLISRERFRRDQDLNFPLLSDFNREVSQRYGSLYNEFALDMKGVSKRSVFLIDQKGSVQYSEVLEDSGEHPNFSKLQTTLNII